MLNENQFLLSWNCHEVDRCTLFDKPMTLPVEASVEMQVKEITSALIRRLTAAGKTTVKEFLGCCNSGIYFCNKNI